MLRMLLSIGGLVFSLVGLTLALHAYAVARRVARGIDDLIRVRNVAMRHLENRDVTGAYLALSMQRDAPEMFRQATFDGDDNGLARPSRTPPHRTA